MVELAFPPGFLWGAATAAHQVEGDNRASDWWAWETAPGTPCREPSGSACEHWTRYPQDVATLAALGFTTYRYSVEWARVEPEDGEFDPQRLEHYRRMTETVREAGLVPMVTLNHFTLPQWVARRGGWLAPETPARFARYCHQVVEALGDLCDWYCTINEPGVVAYGGYLGALGFPPGLTTVRAWEGAIDGLVAGHRAALAAVKDARPQARAGLTHAMQEWVASPGGVPAMRFMRRRMEDVFLAASVDDDFVGVQTYTRTRVHVPRPLGPLSRVALAVPPLRRALVPGMVARRTDDPAATRAEPGVRTTQMGYEYRPQAVAATLRRAAELLPGKDLVVTEHGIATDDDTERVGFVTEGLTAVHEVIAEGLPVRGYVHWSLLDNFEWAHGYGMRFGLVGVDRQTQQRTVHPSARLLGEVARTGRLAPSG